MKGDSLVDETTVLIAAENYMPSQPKDTVGLDVYVLKIRPVSIVSRDGYHLRVVLEGV